MDRTLSSVLRVRSWAVDAALPKSAAGAHAALELAVVEQGELQYRVGRATLVVPQGAAVLVPLGAEHVTTSATAVRATSIHLGVGVLAEVADSLGTGQGRMLVDAVVLKDATRLGALLGLLVDEAGQSDAHALLAADALMEATAVEVLRRVPANASVRVAGRVDGRVARVLEQIAQQYSEPLHVEDLARTAGMSRFHFSRAFQAATGRSPYRYLQEVRLQHAAAMLNHGHVSVTEAALSSGFTDLGRFGRMFRQAYGVTPGQRAQGARHQGNHQGNAPPPAGPPWASTRTASASASSTLRSRSTSNSGS